MHQRFVYQRFRQLRTSPTPSKTRAGFAFATTLFATTLFATTLFATTLFAAFALSSSAANAFPIAKAHIGIRFAASSPLPPPAPPPAPPAKKRRAPATASPATASPATALDDAAVDAADEGAARDDVRILPDDAGEVIRPDAPDQDPVDGPLPGPIPSSPNTKKPPAKARSTRKPVIKARPKARRARVGGVLISQASDAVVLRKLRRDLASRLRAPVALSDGERTFSLRRDQLGASAPLLRLLREARSTDGDVPLRFSVDARVARRALKRLAGQVNRKGSRADLDVDDAGHVVLRGGSGVALAVEGSVLRVKEALEERPPRARVELVVARMSTQEAPDERMITLLQMRYVLASFSTPYDAGIRGRTNNLRMAAALVNGEIVPPGAVFSTNQAIGPRNAAAGWREAKMFVDGQVVSGVGAGICQCSSTLYNAALLAGLPIVERHQHMFRVSYAKPSRDAAIYWGQKDMRFRNDTSGPIYVQTWLAGGRFHVRLFGVEPPRAQVEIISRTLGHSGGTRSEAYRVMKTSGGTTRQRLSRDFYKPHP
jgi:vancomycin resistance protein YoaR